MLIAVSMAGGRQASVRLKRPSERRSLSRSATRALDVLEFFGEVRRPLRAVEISRIGSAYLSMLEDSQVKRLADRARMPATEIPTLLGDVARIRSEGYADGPSTGDTMWSIAMPLPKQGLRVPTVLGLAGPTEQVRKQNTQLRKTMSDAITRWIVEPANHR